MADTLTTNTRSGVVKTVSSHYFFNIGAALEPGSVSEWDGATATLEWSETPTGPWYPIKDSSDVNIARTIDSNGIVTTGKNGFLSVDVTGGAEATQNIAISLIPV